jgi:hypothetical protein
MGKAGGRGQRARGRRGGLRSGRVGGEVGRRWGGLNRGLGADAWGKSLPLERGLCRRMVSAPVVVRAAPNPYRGFNGPLQALAGASRHGGTIDGPVGFVFVRPHNAARRAGPDQLGVVVAACAAGLVALKLAARAKPCASFLADSPSFAPGRGAGAPAQHVRVGFAAH